MLAVEGINWPCPRPVRGICVVIMLTSSNSGNASLTLTAQSGGLAIEKLAQPERLGLGTFPNPICGVQASRIVSPGLPRDSYENLVERALPELSVPTEPTNRSLLEIKSMTFVDRN